ncbi:MAG TPA: shikimate dehydrogenase [Candidatus Eisenbacteria bacterium]|nr:shikimate dehydrogenase [Candidatus Eisenbacteria bacterium]
MDRTITGCTDLLVIIADPVSQARSPALVNAALATRERDAVMVPLRVKAGDLEPVLAGLRAIHTFRGALVSMPHKTVLVDLLDEVLREGRQVGACNVLRREPDGRLVGTMFDGEGFVGGLRAAGHHVGGKRVFLAGAGGAASGIAFAMGKHGAAALTIHNRTAAKATALAARVRAAWPALAVATGGPDPSDHDLVVNATSLGMQPGDALPLDVTRLTPGTVAAEVVIRPEPTPFLAEAAKRGCAVHHGEPMLAAQIDLAIDFMLPPA